VKTLVWTSAARADLDGIAEFHAGADKRVGDMLVGRIEQAAAKLARYDTGRPGRIAGTREKSVANTRHIIVYEIHDDLLFIFRIVHTARNWP
jgi:plasmid stabilization system protein ParE